MERFDYKERTFRFARPPSAPPDTEKVVAIFLEHPRRALSIPTLTCAQAVQEGLLAPLPELEEDQQQQQIEQPQSAERPYGQFDYGYDKATYTAWRRVTGKPKSVAELSANIEIPDGAADTDGCTDQLDTN